MQQQYIENTLELMDFIQDSPTAFHTVENAVSMLKNEGFELLDEKNKYSLKLGGKYCITRNGSALIAFILPSEEVDSYSIISAHTDSPCFKIKENPEVNAGGLYTTLNIEAYGGAIYPAWFDRPLSIAGRVLLKGRTVRQVLVDLDRDLCVIPNLCIHQNREINKGLEYKVQTDMLPLISSGFQEGALKNLIASTLEVDTSDILESELFLYNRDRGHFFGLDNEFFTSPRIDDQMSAFCAVKTLANQQSASHAVKMVCLFDNEETGSETKQGAASDFLIQTVNRISAALEIDYQKQCMIQASSMALSADNGHSMHPNYISKCDPTNHPAMNRGIMIKYAGNQKYATDGFSAGMLKNILEKAKVPYQVFFNNSNFPGGSTLGNISNSQFSIATVDVGCAQLAMHSPNETAGTEDTLNMLNAFEAFFN